MRGFIWGVFLTLFAGAVSAALVELAPVAPVRVAASIALAACVYFAARSGSPGFPLLGHIFGLVFALLGLLVNWFVWLTVINDFDYAAALQIASQAPDALMTKLYEISDARSVAVGGRVIEGPTLRVFWIGQAALLAVAGLFGGQSAREIRRERRRVEQERAPIASSA